MAAGAWFVVGRAAAGPLGLGEAGQPVAVNETQRVWLELTYFSGLGALIVFLGALAVGRLSVRTARDIAYRDAHAEPVEPSPVTTGTGPAPALDQSDAATEPVGRRRTACSAGGVGGSSGQAADLEPRQDIATTTSMCRCVVSRGGRLPVPAGRAR